MQPLKATHISTVHSAFDIRIFHKQCRSLAAFGMEVNLVITHDKEEVIDQVKIIPLPKFRNRFTRIFFKPFLAFWKAFKTNADIFHFHDPELIPMGLVLKLFGKKVVYDIHEDVAADILDKYWIPPRLRFLISLILRCIESFGARFFDGIVTATPHIRDIFLPKNNNTIDVNNYPLVEELMDLKYIKCDGKANKKIISYVGGISKERGIFEVLKALEGSDVKLHLAGTVSPHGLINDLEKCPGWKNVQYFGHLTRSEVSSLLSNSHMGICTFHPLKNHLHAVPNKIFEYMSAGIPVIISKFPRWENFFKEIGNVFLVDPLDPAEIKQAIKNLIENQKTSCSMGRKGLKAVQENYNWDIECEKLIICYKKIINF